MYPDTVEYFPPSAPSQRGNLIQVSFLVDSNHAGDKIIRHSQSGIILCSNKAPIVWYYNRDTTVESSTFGSEFVALRVASEIIISLSYRFLVFSVPILGHTDILFDNEALCNNTAFSK